MSSGFTTGPNFLPFEYEAKCVNAGLPCSAAGVGNSFTALLPKKLTSMNATVTELSQNVTYWCYVITSLNKLTKCKGPVEAKTGTSPSPSPPQPPSPPPPPPPPVSLLGINANQPSNTFFKQDITGPAASYKLLSNSEFTFARVGLSGVQGAFLRSVSGRAPGYPLYYSSNLTEAAPTFSYVNSSFMVGVSMSGSSIAGIDGSGDVVFVSDVANNASETIPAPDLQQISLSGAGVLGLSSNGSLYFTSDISVGSWQSVDIGSLDLTEVSLSGTIAAALDTAGGLWYTDSVTTGNWVNVTLPNVPSPFILEHLSISGYQVVTTSSNPNVAQTNIYYAPDIRNPVWQTIAGSLAYISTSLP